MILHKYHSHFFIVPVKPDVLENRISYAFSYLGIIAPGWVVVFSAKYILYHFYSCIESSGVMKVLFNIMYVFIVQSLLLSVTYIFVEFLVSPGDGEEFVYSPVEVNATIHCAVNNTMLGWEVDGLNFDNSIKRNELHSRGIFHNEPILSSNGVTASNLIVFGDIDVNSNIRICCESQVMSCLLYTSPSPRDATLSRMPSSA